jgi:hypothetical protein
MATQTLQGDVPVPCVDYLLSHGVARMFRPIVAGSTKFDNRRLLQKKNTIRRMRGMTSIAIPFLNGVVSQSPFDHGHLSFCCLLFLRFFLGKLYLELHRIRMALSTESERTTQKQFLLGGGMSLVAIEATLSI